MIIKIINCIEICNNWNGNIASTLMQPFLKVVLEKHSINWSRISEIMYNMTNSMEHVINKLDYTARTAYRADEQESLIIKSQEFNRHVG